MDECEKEDIGRFLLPREELRVPLSIAVEPVLVVIGQQDIEAEHLAGPSWVILLLQPCVNVLVGTNSWAVCVSVAMAVIMFVVMGV